MCGRVTLTETLESIGGAYKASFNIEQAGAFRTSFNVAPTQRLCIINNEDGQRVGRVMKWGLLPSWVSDPSTFKASTFNARDDRIKTSKVFYKPFKKNRCLIIISGYYEWREEEGSKTKQPYYFVPKQGKTLALAGLWERSMIKRPDGSTEPLETCTIITTDPNEVTAEYHNRMPVILMPEDHDIWMSPDTPEEQLFSLLKPCPPDYLDIIKVDKRVGSVRNDGPENIRPLESDSLF